MINHEINEFPAKLTSIFLLIIKTILVKRETKFNRRLPTAAANLNCRPKKSVCDPDSEFERKKLKSRTAFKNRLACLLYSDRSHLVELF